jgi:threonine/homoserine/homoserine lactone efflux protein
MVGHDRKLISVYDRKKIFKTHHMSTYVSSIASTQVSPSPDSSMMMSSATKRLATRAIITGVGSAAFSVFYLGVPFTTATVKNAALMSGSCTLGSWQPGI